MVRRLLVPCALVGMLTLAGLTLAPIYRGSLLPTLVAVAALGSVLISVLVRRLPPWTAAPASVVGLAGLTFFAVRISAQAGQVAGSVPEVARDALRNSIPRLLTAMIPIEPQPDTVLVPVIATWLAGLAAAEVGVRYQRVLLCYAAPTLLLGGALYLVGPNARSAGWLPLAYAGCAVLGLAATARQAPAEAALPMRKALRIRLGAGAAVGLAIIVALSQAIGPTVADQGADNPTDPRRLVTPPQLDSLDENPLVKLSGWALNGDQHLLDATVADPGGSDPNPRIRLAVLSDYDGVTWRVGAVYRNAGRVLTGPPGDERGPALGPDVEQQITIDELDGRLLPGIATPQRIDGVRIAYDETTGTMALPDGLRQGLRYTVVSREQRIDDNQLSVAEVASDDTVSRFLALPGKVPDRISQLSQHLGEGVSAPYQRALAVQQWLEEHYKLVTDAPSGHAYPNVDFFLFGPKQAGGQKGTSEQFSAAFAVLARSLGLPTRVTVGFQAKPGVNSIRGRDAIAWPEVLFQGVGWIPFDPLPKSDTVQRPVEDDFRPKALPSVPPPQPVPEVSVSTSAKPSAKPSESTAATAPDNRTAAVFGILAAGSVGAGLLVFFALVPVVRRSQRRKRLGQGQPSARISAAWSEVLDGLRLAGRPAPAHLSASEVAAYALTAANARAHSRAGPRLRPSTPPIDDLAALTNVVAFAGPQTVRGRPAGPSEEQAGHATAQAIAYVDELRARRSWWRRLRWSLDPRPLAWNSRRAAREARTRPNSDTA